MDAEDGDIQRTIAHQEEEEEESEKLIRVRDGRTKDGI